MKFLVRRADTGYLDTDLWVPKSAVNVEGVRNALTFQTLEQQKMRLLTLYKETEHHILVPREFWKPKDFQFPVIDCRPRRFPSVHVTSRVQLDHKFVGDQLVPTGRRVQREAMDALLQSQGGILQLSCGGGKTVVALDYFARMGMPALIVVDTTQLVIQWQAEIESFLDVPGGVGLIQADVFDWKKSIVIATYHTLADRAALLSEEVRRWFGVVLWDECFPAGTLVDGRPIDTYSAGARVRSFNHLTGDVEVRQVLRTFVSRPRHLVRVHFHGGASCVVTAGHPFYTQRGYVEAGELQKHDTVATLPEERDFFTWVGVDRVEVLEPGRDGTFGGLCPDGLVYNLEVEGNNNYFVDNLLVHNCHHVAAPTFARSANLFYGRRFGLSATPHRDDGMQVVYEHHLGPVLYKNLDQELKPRFYFVWTGMELDVNDPKVQAAARDKNGELHIGKVAGVLGSWPARIQLVVDQIEQATAQKRKVLVLSKSVDALVNLLAAWNKRPSLFTDIAFPTAQDVGERTPPQELTKEEHVKVQKQLFMLDGSIASLRQSPQTAKTATKLQMELSRQVTLQLMMDAHRVFKKCEVLWNQLRSEYIEDLLAQPSTAGLMIHRIKPKLRAKMLREKQVTFAIMKYGREGLNEKSLDTCIVNEPISSRNTLQQLMGRLLREKAGKQEPVVVFLEDNIGPFIGMCKTLRRHLITWPADEGGPFSYTNIQTLPQGFTP